MSDIILPVNRNHPNGYDYTIITDDHIRAIVERATAMGLLEHMTTVRTTTETTLEAANEICRSAVVSVKCGTCNADFSPGHVCAKPAAPAGEPLVFGPPQPRPYHIDPDEIRKHMNKHAAPADDEATVNVLRRIFYTGGHMGEVVAAIRRGEVHGLTTTAELDALREELLSKDEVDLVDERDALKAEVERLRAEVEHWKNAHAGVVSAEKAVFADAERLRQELQSIRGRAASAMHDICGMGSDPTVTDPVETLIAYAAQWYADRRELQAERDAATSRAEAAEVRLAMQSHDYETARAAHAEAMALLREIAKLDSGNIYSTVPHGDMSRVKNYIAKYDKTERHEPFPDYLKGA